MAILWAPDGVADDWQSGDTLAASCTDPENAVPRRFCGHPAMLFVSRALGPLRWFGLMELREMQHVHDVVRWRKTALFDRLLSFDVPLADPLEGGH